MDCTWLQGLPSIARWYMPMLLMKQTLTLLVNFFCAVRGIYCWWCLWEWHV